MKHYAVFVMRFSLAAIISGPFVVSTTWPASLIEWAHVITGFAVIYLIVGLLLRSTMYPELRLPGGVALVLALLEAIPAVPRLHAAVAPLLFAALAWAAVAKPAEPPAPVARKGSKKIFILPALVVIAILYGDSYRHQTSGVAIHIAAAMLAAGVVLFVCLLINQNHPHDASLRGMANLTIAAVLFQIVAGATALVIRLLDVNGGLALGLSRTAHITGAGPLLAASTLLAIQYRRTAPTNPVDPAADASQVPDQSAPAIPPAKASLTSPLH